MLVKTLRSVMLLVFVVAVSNSVHAADTSDHCRLRGGDVVPLPAAACVREGGAVVTGGAPAISDDKNASPAPILQLSADPKMGAAQKAILDLLDKLVVDTTPLVKSPEGVERTARFDGCKLMADEYLHIDLGNIFTSRKELKISTTIDLQKIDPKAFGVLGTLNSLAGGLKAAAVYFEERKLTDGNNISISVLKSRDDKFEKLSLHGSIPYLDAPKDDLWIQDEYGYPKESETGDLITDKVRILYIVQSLEDAEKLNTALHDMSAMCKTNQASH